MTPSTTGMMVNRSRCAVVLVSRAVAVTPPTSAAGSSPFMLSRSATTAFSASFESAAKSRVALISTLPPRTAGAVGAPGAPVIGTLLSASR